MNEREYRSTETKNKLMAELLPFLRFVILVSFLFSPMTTILYFIVYIIFLKKTNKKQTKRTILIISSVIFVIAFLANITNVLFYFKDGFHSIVDLLKVFFYDNLEKIANVINQSLGYELNFKNVFLKWMLGSNIVFFSLNFFIVSLMMFFYKQSDELFFEEAEKKRKNKHEDSFETNIKLEEKGHVFCVGTTRSGKTANVLRYVEKSFIDGDFIALIDGKGDMSDFSLYDVVKKMCVKYNRKFYTINQSDIKETKPYNPFRNAKATQSKDMLLSMSEWSEEYYKIQAERYWQCMASVLIELGLCVSFDNLIKYSDNKNLAKLIKENKKHLSDNLYETAINIITGEEGKNAQTASARFSVIAEGEGKSFFSDDGFDMRQAYLDNAVVLVLLDSFAYNEFAKSMGYLVIEDMKNLISAINSGEVERKNILYVYDEVSVYINPQLIGLLNRGSSAGVRNIVATQSISDIDFVSIPLRKQVLENCNNYVIMRVNESDGAQAMADIVGTEINIEQTRRTADGEYTGESSNKTVDEYRINPNDIKELPNLIGFFYSKNNPKEVIKFKTIFVEV